MATIINNPAPAPASAPTEGGNGSGGGSGLIVGIIFAVVVIALLFFFVLPNMQGGNAPAPNAGMKDNVDTVNVQVPDEIDVNVKK